ncbi:unannotated protein [freshwater metagenome]|uniref:Unannotated protein n=1 Tax=freshwater metagenome TaxID=449393 RepID=A0A6J7VK11_9ZZZZ
MLTTLASWIAIRRACGPGAVRSEPHELKLSDDVGERRNQVAVGHHTTNTAAATSAMTAGAIGGEDCLTCCKL